MLCLWKRWIFTWSKLLILTKQKSLLGTWWILQQIFPFSTPLLLIESKKYYLTKEIFIFTLSSPFLHPLLSSSFSSPLSGPPLSLSSFLLFPLIFLLLLLLPFLFWCTVILLSQAGSKCQAFPLSAQLPTYWQQACQSHTACIPIKCCAQEVFFFRLHGLH